ncbi:hypothetical protein L195_g057637, partial [Trifolium pratense]
MPALGLLFCSSVLLSSLFGLEKTLTAPDVETGTLTIYWRGFCQNALPNEETKLRLIDWLGNTWDHCDLKFGNGPYISCKISGQWGDVCK